MIRSSTKLACCLFGALLLLTSAAPAATIDSIDYCVSPGVFRFSVELGGVPAGTAAFRIAASGQAFVSPHERFVVNFDGTTGAISAGPYVETNGTVALDRWQDGEVGDFQISVLGGGSFLLEGTIAAGANPFLAGDEVSQTVLRPQGESDIVISNVLVAACAAASPGIESAAFCTETGVFLFQLILEGVPAGINIIRIASTGDAFVSPVERFSLNFDGTTGAISVGPLVETVGMPEYDRWLDGGLVDFSLENLGEGRWEILGMMQHGADPLLHGSSVPTTAYRPAGGGGDVILADQPVVNCGGGQPTIQKTFLCVGPSIFRFSTELYRLPVGTAIFRMGAEANPFTGPTERIAFNFDAETGELLSEPVVELAGASARDCWVNGPIEVTLYPLGAGAWRVQGAVPHGTSPLTIGETVDTIAIRTSAFPDVLLQDVECFECGMRNDTRSWGHIKSLY